MSFLSGWLLVGLVAGLFSLAVLDTWLIMDFKWSWMRLMELPTAKLPWRKAVAISLAGLFILTIYPVGWRESVFGSIFTILLGIVFLFLLVSAIAELLSPPVISLPASAHQPAPPETFEDALDDVAAIYQWLRRHAGSVGFLMERFEKWIAITWIRAILDWINPRL